VRFLPSAKYCGAGSSLNIRSVRRRNGLLSTNRCPYLTPKTSSSSNSFSRQRLTVRPSGLAEKRRQPL